MDRRDTLAGNANKQASAITSMIFNEHFLEEHQN